MDFYPTNTLPSPVLANFAGLLADSPTSVKAMELSPCNPVQHPASVAFAVPPEKSPKPAKAAECFPSKSTQSSAAAKFADPLGKAPMVGPPLNVLTGIQGFPTEYAEKRPRLVDVCHHLGFDSEKDCSKLRCMDAIVTVLWHYSPDFLDLFLPPVALPTWVVEYNRFSGSREPFDLCIKRQGCDISVSIPALPTPISC